jgi:hypothetical protein
MELASNAGRHELVGAGAFRSAAVRPLCAACGEAAESAACARCGAPLCAAHAPGIARRCDACEESYLALRLDRQRHPLPAAALVLSYLAAGAVVGVAGHVLAEAGVHAWALAVAAISGFAPLYVAGYRRGVLRARFLAERPGSPRLRLSRATERALARDASRPRQRWDELSIAAFTIACVGFYLPLVPLMSAILGGWAVRTWPRRGGKRGRELAIAALVLGLIFFTVHLLLLALLLAT